MLKPRRIRGASSLFVLLSRLLLGLLLIFLFKSEDVVRQIAGFSSLHFRFFVIIYFSLPMPLPFVIPILVLLLFFWALSKSKDAVPQTEHSNLETRAVELTDEHKRIMERFGVTYEDYKFHYEGKVYNSLSDVPLKKLP